MRNGNGSSRAEPRIGRSLELARKQRGLSLHQVEQETKIRARYLRELERDNFDVLPPVYMQGSLKTYANFLGLDGETLTRELKRRHPLGDDQEAPTHIEPPKSDYLDRYLVSLGAADAETREIAEDEEAAGRATAPVDNSRLYAASAAFLVLALVAVVLVLTLPRNTQPEVSEVREPLISQAPSEVSRVGDEVGDEESEPVSRQVADEGDDLKPKQQAASPDEDARDDGEPAQGPRDATAASSATPAAETATAEPNATPAPTTEEPATSQPAPAASEAPVRNDQGVVGSLQARGPAEQDDEGPVKNFSIMREKNATMGNTSGSCPRNDGGLVEIRRGNKGAGACPAGNAADRNNDRQRQQP
jgi:cytoskeletal protein RodZ